MQRTSFIKLLLKVILRIVIFNLFFLILTFLLFFITKYTFTKILLTVIGFLGLYISLLKLAYKDGSRERNLVKYNHVEGILKWRWMQLGFVAFGLTAFSSVVLLICRIGMLNNDILIVYRFVNGLLYPLSLIIYNGPNLSELPIYAPFVFMLCYLPMPFVMQYGFNEGLKATDLRSKILYKK